ncbi:MAG: metalloregulator ArsR/SmtB family transcription factor [Octadecabacter sp.]
MTNPKNSANIPTMPRDLSAIFSALSDPTRRAVVEQLAKGPASVTTLASDYDIALPTFMRHLKILETCGLVRSVKKGRVRTCHIEAAPMMELQGWLEWQRRVWEDRMDQLGDIAVALEQNPTPKKDNS